MTEQMRWFEYGEPIDNKRVKACIRTTYQTGPHESQRDDDVVEGTVTFDTLELIAESDEIQQHVHDDESISLSMMDDETEESLLEDFDTAE